MLPSLTVAAAACLIVSLLPLAMTFLFAEASNRPTIPFGEAVQGRCTQHPC